MNIHLHSNIKIRQHQTLTTSFFSCHACNRIQIEPAVVVITLRIVAKYCLELESVAASKVDSFSPQQLACFVSTLKVIDH